MALEALLHSALASVPENGCPSLSGFYALVDASLAPSTRRAYISAFNGFCAWAATAHPKPPDVSLLLPLYLAFLSQRSVSSSVLNTARSAVLWFLTTRGTRISAHASTLIACILRAHKRVSPVPVHRAKAPLQHVRTILLDAFFREPSLTSCRFGTAVTLLFAGYLRPSELLGLHLADVTFSSSSAILLVRSSKCQQPGIGSAQEVFISPSQTRICPVRILRLWLSIRPPSAFLFPSLSRPDLPMSYSVLRSQLREACIRLSLPILTPHSFRGGAATHAAESGIPKHAIMLAGRWASDGGVAPYIQRSEASLRGASALLH